MDPQTEEALRRVTAKKTEETLKEGKTKKSGTPPVQEKPDFTPPAQKPQKQKEEPKQDEDAQNTEPDGDGGLVLGVNKTVYLKPWNGKTKKKFKKLFVGVEGPEDVNFEKVVEILLYDHIEPKVYLNEGEQTYLIAKLKEISLSENIGGRYSCPSCGEDNLISSTIKECVNYKENHFPFKYSDEIEFVDIPSLEYLKDQISIIQDDNWDGITSAGDIELACHIKIKDKNIKDVIDYLDEMPVKDLETLLIKLEEVSPRCTIQTKKHCVHCQTENVFDLDLTEEIFETLLK
jgi:hypothetical protein